MKITFNTGYYTRKNNYKDNNTNHSQKQNMSTPNFKGYTYEMKCYPTQYKNGCYHTGYVGYAYHLDNMKPRLKETGFKLNYNNMTEAERDLWSKTEEIPLRIYIASPNEQIPQKIYKTHTHIERNDLLLSQLKYDYIYRYCNFAQNAYLEAEHYKEVIPQQKELIQNNKNKIEEIKQHCEEIKQRHQEIKNYFEQPLKEDCSEKLKNSLPNKEQLKTTEQEEIDEQQKEITELQQEIEEAQQIINRAQQNINKAEKRYEFLKVIDDLSGEKEKVKKQINDNDSDYRRTRWDKEEFEQEREPFLKLYEQRQLQLKIAEETSEIKNKDVLIKKANESIENIKQEIEIYNKKIEECENIMQEHENLKKHLEEVVIEDLNKQLTEQYQKTEKFYREYYPEWCDI